MGGYLSKTLEWKDASELFASEANEHVFAALRAAITRLVESHEREAATTFATAVQFYTRAVSIERLASSREAHEYVEAGMNALESKERDSDHRPMYSIARVNDGTNAVHVRSIRQLHNHLRQIGSEKDQLREIKTILEANRSIINTIAGIDGESGDILVRGFRQMNAQEGKAAQETSNRMQLMIVLNQLDLELLAQTIDAARKGGADLTLEQVSKEVEYLQRFARDGVQSVLASIGFDEQFVFGSGPQVMPWRAARGELAYITAAPASGDKIHITATRKGYFVNEGYVVDAKGDAHLGFERKSEVAPSLVDLLCLVSPRFSRDSSSQLSSFAARLGLSAKQHDPAAGPSMAGAAGVGAGLHQGQYRRKHSAGLRVSGAAARRAGGASELRLAEPSAKWQSLAIEERMDEAVALQQRTAAAQAAKAQRRRRGNESARSLASDTTAGGAAAAAAAAAAHASDGESDSDSGPEEDQQRDFGNYVLQQRDYPLFERVQKLVQLMRVSAETATVLCLVHLLDSALDSEPAQFAIVDSSGLDVLVNLLAIHYSRCQLGALKVLNAITQSRRMQSALEAMRGIGPLCELLRTGSEEVQRLAADTLGNCCDQVRPCRAIREAGGVPLLVAILAAAHAYERPSAAVRSAARALWRCARSRANRRAMLACDIVATLAALLTGRGAARGGQLVVPASEEYLVPLFGIMQSCAQDADFRAQVRAAGLVPLMLAYLAADSPTALQTQCAAALFRCAADSETQRMLTPAGLSAVVRLLDTSDAELLTAVTGCLWMSAQAQETVPALLTLGAVPKLVQLLGHPSEAVQVNAAGALQSGAQVPDVRLAILAAGGIPRLVAKLKETNDQLLINATGAIGACAREKACLAQILADDVDGVKFLWSLLKKKSPAVVTAAAWAICPCLTADAAPGHLVNEFVGGLELVVSLLKIHDDNVRAAVCAVIAQIAKSESGQEAARSENNLGVMTDHGAVWMLADLAHTHNDHLRANLAEAIACVAEYDTNRETFAQAKAVKPLVSYLASHDPAVHRHTARALHQLSFFAPNCIAMHEAGAVRPLLFMIGSPDPLLAEAAAGCLSNIRVLALANERASRDDGGALLSARS